MTCRWTASSPTLPRSKAKAITGSASLAARGMRVSSRGGQAAVLDERLFQGVLAPMAELDDSRSARRRRRSPS